MNPKDRLTSSKLVALGAAAVMSVYSAGYARTRTAAERFAGGDTERRAPTHTDVDGERAAQVRAPEPAASPAPVATESIAQNVSRAVEPAVGDARTKRDSQTTVTPSQTAVVAALPTPAPSVDTARTPEVTPAPAPEAPAPKQEAPRPQLADGTFTGYGTSRHGDIEATVEIKNGRITAASISQCLTRYSCSWISALPGQVVARQSAEVDYVSGATQSTNAFYYAVVEALKKAK
ncbi:MAG: FMN-binding protein [Gemmatimonadota bacterium]